MSIEVVNNGMARLIREWALEKLFETRKRFPEDKPAKLVFFPALSAPGVCYDRCGGRYVWLPSLARDVPDYAHGVLLAFRDAIEKYRSYRRKRVGKFHVASVDEVLTTEPLYKHEIIVDDVECLVSCGYTNASGYAYSEEAWFLTLEEVKKREKID